MKHLRFSTILIFLISGIGCSKGEDPTCNTLPQPTCQLVKIDNENFEQDELYYYENGRLVQYQDQRTSWNDLEYDQLGRIGIIKTFHIPPYGISGFPSYVKVYLYDEQDRVIDITRTSSSPPSASENQTFSYNAVGQLIEEKFKTILDGEIIVEGKKIYDYPNNCTLNYSKATYIYASGSIDVTIFKYDTNHNPKFDLKLSPTQTSNNIIKWYDEEFPSNVNSYEYTYNKDGYPIKEDKNKKVYTYINCKN